MSDMPERIWVNQKNLPWVDPWPEQQITDTDVEYIRLDVAQAMVAAAYEAAAQVAADWGDGFAQKNNHYGTAATRVAAIIRRMLPADALAAQAARDERMRAEGRAEAEARGRLRGIEEAADKFRDCWDDPEAEDDGFAHNTEVAIRALGERGRLCRQPDDIKTR